MDPNLNFIFLTSLLNNCWTFQLDPEVDVMQVSTVSMAGSETRLETQLKMKHVYNFPPWMYNTSMLPSLNDLSKSNWNELLFHSASLRQTELRFEWKLRVCLELVTGRKRADET